MNSILYSILAIITVATFFRLLPLAHRQINELVGTIALFFLPLFTPRKLLMPDAPHMRAYNGYRIDALYSCTAQHSYYNIIICYIGNINVIKISIINQKTYSRMHTTLKRCRRLSVKIISVYRWH